MSGKTLKVAVLMGGISSEREISLLSGKGVMRALQKLGYQAKAIDVTEDLGALVKQLKTFKPDVVFNALHGRGGGKMDVSKVSLIGLKFLIHIQGYWRPAWVWIRK